MAFHVGIDIGGTFTDLVGYDETTNRLVTAKASTTPGDLSRGIEHCLEQAGTAAAGIASLTHGSTVAINIAIERTGAKTALVVTRGTRDVYAIGRGNRPNAYDIAFRRPAPLVPRRLTFEIDERLGPTGETWQAFDEAQARSVADDLAAGGVEAVAVCFLHAWRNPSHERRMLDVLRAALPGVFLTASHEILREYGEYERMSTTALNAYLGPDVSRYLERLDERLRTLGFGGRLLIMQSNGGVMTPAAARARPVAMLESGPVAGFIAAARAGRDLDRPKVIAFDMGGTTAKTTLIEGNEPRMAHGYHIGGYAEGQPVLLPVVDTVEVGSGGGSLAWVDEAGVLQVGPRSAGAVPGPIAYGRGGVEPTVTDANLVLGRLGARSLLGGALHLDVDAARDGIAERVARPLGLSITDAALAILKVAVLRMSLAVREVSVARGYDPRDFALLAFGGAGPLHAADVARELHVPTVVVPVVPGQFSAAGMLIADVRHDYVQTCHADLDRADGQAIDGIFADMIDAGMTQLADEGIPPDRRTVQRLLEIRYAGQDFTLPVTVDERTPIDPAAIGRAFGAIHLRQFGYADADHGLELVNVRVAAIGRRDADGAWRPAAPAPSPRGVIERRPVWFEVGGAPLEVPVHDREGLRQGCDVTGPAVIEEYGSTTLLLPGDRAIVAPTGAIVIDVGGGGR